MPIITLKVGDTFDPLKNVTASDFEDGPITLTQENIIQNDVDTSKAGIYHVTYKVTDSEDVYKRQDMSVHICSTSISCFSERWVHSSIIFM